MVSNGFQACEIQKSRPGEGENSQGRVLRYGGIANPHSIRKTGESLGRVFDESLTNKSMRGAILHQTIEGLQAIEAAPLQGRFKVWLLQFVLLPRLLWPLTIYEIGLSVVEKLERKVNRYTRKWVFRAFLQRCHRFPSTAGARACDYH